MSHLIWTNFFVASLIFLGDGASIPDVTQRANAEASIINHIVEASTSVPTDDPESHYHQAIFSDNELQAALKFIHQSTITEKLVISCSVKYHTFNPRAPPGVFS